MWPLPALRPRGKPVQKKASRKKVLSLAKFMKKTVGKKGGAVRAADEAAGEAPANPASPSSSPSLRPEHMKKRLSIPITHNQLLDRGALAMSQEEEEEAETHAVPLRPESSWADKVARRKKLKQRASRGGDMSVMMGEDWEAKCRLSFAVVDRLSFDELVQQEEQLSSRSGTPTGRQMEQLLLERKSVRLKGEDLRQAFAERYTLIDTSRGSAATLAAGANALAERPRTPAVPRGRRTTSSSRLVAAATKGAAAQREQEAGAAREGEEEGKRTEGEREAAAADTEEESQPSGDTLAESGKEEEQKEREDGKVAREVGEEGDDEVVDAASAEELRKRSQRRAVVQELVETERYYIDKLQLVINVFLLPIRANSLLTPYEIATLFGNIEDLLPLHVAIMDDLESALLVVEQSEGVEPLYAQWVGEIFAEHAPLLARAYVSYCSNQPAINSRLKEYKQSHPEFQEFLTECLRKEECKKQDLASFLIQPMQRLCKYPLFFGQLQKYTAEEDEQSRFLKEGRTQVLSLVDEVNYKVNHISNLTALVEVNMRLENAEMWQSTIVRDHELLYETVEEINEQQMTLFVFSDMLLICKTVQPPAATPEQSRHSASDTPVAATQPKRRRQPKLRVDKLVAARSCSVLPDGEQQTEVLLLVDEVDQVRITCTNRQRKRLLERKLRLCFSAAPAAPALEVPDVAAVDFVEPTAKVGKRSHSSFSKSNLDVTGQRTRAGTRVSDASALSPPASDEGPKRSGRKRARVRSMPPTKLQSLQKQMEASAPVQEDPAVLRQMAPERLVEMLLASRRLATEQREAAAAAEEKLHDLEVLYELVKSDSRRFQSKDPPLDLAAENRRLRAQLGAAQARIIAFEEGGG